MYIGYFGVTVFAVAFVLFYETTPAGQERKKAAKAAAKAFEDIHIRKCAVDDTGAHACGVQVTHWGLTRIIFTFYGQEFSFNPLWPVLGGFVIAAISAFIGVGGLSRVPHLGGRAPHVHRGGTGPGGLVSMITSIFTFMFVKACRGLCDDLHRIDRHCHRFRPGAPHLQVHPGGLAEAFVRGPGGVRGHRLPDQGLFRSIDNARNVRRPKISSGGAGFASGPPRRR
jgi:hypothetical protein